jgi:hypothetical protein
MAEVAPDDLPFLPVLLMVCAVWDFLVLRSRGTSLRPPDP